jgi:hypothetical protein
MTVVASPIRLAALSTEALLTTGTAGTTEFNDRLLREDLLLPEALAV